jgi:cobalt-zinc-cadmium efflux system outer membrane protein
MQVSNFELLVAKQEEQRAEQEAIEALRDYWVARAELEKAAGGSLAQRTASRDSKAPTTAGPPATPHANHQH